MVKRVSLLAALLLLGCGKAPDHSEWDASQQIALTDLEARMARVERDLAQDEATDRAMFNAVGNDLHNIQNQVSDNAKIANDNGKIDAARWQWVKDRVR